MPKERILITVKAYPTPSRRYGEISCAAGFKEDGSWIRLFPIAFRQLSYERRYKKYQWIEADIERYSEDNRPESYRVVDDNSIIPLDKIDTLNQWEKRKEIVFKKEKIYKNLKEIIKLAHENKISLAIFKPSEIVDFVVGDIEEDYSQSTIDQIYQRRNQRDFFEKNFDDFELMPKIDKKFSFKFKDELGKESKLMIVDWEIEQLYLNCREKYSQEKATEKVREKYLYDFAKKKDLYFFLGTTSEGHRRKFTNPYIIIGTFHPPYAVQERFL